MAAIAQTLKEIAIDKATKRPELADWITEDAPILDSLKWIPASHGLWNVTEVLTGIDGPSFVDLGAPLPTVQARTGLEETYVSVMGGEQEVAVEKAPRFGGPEKYFARREKPIMRQAGMDTETAIYEAFWRKAALQKSLYTSAGGTAAGSGNTGLYSIMVVRMDEELNIGIYDPTGFVNGRLLEISPINGGTQYHLRSQEGVLGYGVSYRGRFGWQLLEPTRTVYSIVNVSTSKLPTMTMIDDAIAAVRGKPSSTFIFGHPRILGRTFSALKTANVQFVNADSNLKTLVTMYNDIRIVGSYNLNDGNEAAVS